MEKIVREFLLEQDELLHEAALVEEALENGMNGTPSPFLLSPSFIGFPAGSEKGSFLALDFGGSNLRIARVALSGCEIRQEDVREMSLQGLLRNGCKDMSELFTRIAREIDAFAGKEGGLLGHTFSYPTVQTGVNNATVQKWTKEVSFVASEAIDINSLLRQKLLDLERADILPAVILNDTVAVFLASAYRLGGESVVGSICGTGHNSCYYEPKRKMVLNLEAGNFSPACRNRFDFALDSGSASPGEQLMEKMTAGNYLAALTVLAAKELGIVDAKIDKALDLSVVLADSSHPLYYVVEAVVRRAAALVAAEYTGICRYIEHRGKGLKKIAVDGSIYNKMNIFQSEVRKTLSLLNEKPPQVFSAHNSSLSGAAVACAVVADGGFL